MNSKRLITALISFALVTITGVSLTLNPQPKSKQDQIEDALSQVLGAITEEQLPPDFVLVTQVVDGDTIKVNFGGSTQTVRLLGIDTPETVDPRKPVQCFGQEASDQLKSLVEGRAVRLETDHIQGDKDKYGRLLRYVYLNDDTFINALMIEKGYAFAYRSLDSDHLQEFINLEDQARNQNIGLWASCPVNIP